MFKSKKVRLLENKVDELVAENKSFNYEKIYEASDRDLIILLKYFDYTSSIGLKIQTEYYERAKLREIGIDLGDKNIFGTLQQNQDLIIKLSRENRDLFNKIGRM